MSRGTGSAPEFSSVLSSVADFAVKPPSMMPVPLVNTFWMFGAEICFPSSVIWTGLLR